MMKDDISHEEYRSKLANVADLAVSYINTGNGYFRMRDAFNGLAEQCGWLCNHPHGSSTSKSNCYDNGG